MKDGCQNHAIWFVCTVRAKFFNPSICAVISGVPNAGGGASRAWPPDVKAHGFQAPASGNAGVGLLHLPGIGANEPVKAASEPSRFAHAITWSATMPPRRAPAVRSDANSTPAYNREVPASATSDSSADLRSGNRDASTEEAALAATAYSDGYDGLFGVSISGTTPVSNSAGRGRPYVYFQAHAETVASCIATATSDIARVAAGPPRL